MEKVVGLVSKPLINGFANIEPKEKLSKEEILKNKQYEKIRKQLLKSTLKELGVKQEDLDRLSGKLEDYNNREEHDKGFMQDVIDSENTLGGAKATIKAGNKETAKKIASFGVSVAAISSVKFAEVQALVASITASVPFIGVALAGVTLGMYLKKRIKMSKYEQGDYSEKDKAFEEKLNMLQQKLTQLNSLIENDKDMLLNKSQTMKKSEFKQFVSGYIKQKLAECGLVGELEAHAMVGGVSQAVSTLNEDEIQDFDINDLKDEEQEEQEEQEISESENQISEEEMFADEENQEEKENGEMLK